MTTRGMMAENMFQGKGIVLGWLNTVLGLRLEKIEDVDFNVRNDYEFVGNYKELQQAFTRNNIDRAFNVAGLSKGKLQDNNEFMQWFKGYWDSITGGLDIEDYDPLARRQLCKTGDWKKWSKGVSGASARPSASADSIAAYRRAGAAPVARPAAIKAGLKAAPISATRLHEAEAEVQDLSEEVADLRLKLETLEHERDFYFDKLRDIEVLCQWPEVARQPVTKLVERILFAADAEEGKQVMDEAAEIYAAPAMEAQL